MILSGIKATNYSLTSVATTTANITKLDISGTFAANDKAYDGNNSATVSDRGLLGLLAADATNVSLTGGTATFSDKNVSIGKTVTLLGAYLSGTFAGDYNLATMNTALANITKVNVNVTAKTDSKEYDGTISSTAVPTIVGLIHPDGVGIFPIQVYDNKNVGINKVLTASGLIINDGNSGLNYNINYFANTTGVITDTQNPTISCIGNKNVYANAGECS